MKNKCSFRRIILFLQVTVLLVLPFYAISQSVSSFTLVNATTNQDIGPLTNGDVLNLSTLPSTSLNIRANTNPAIVGSVNFGYDGNSNFHVENVVPYTFAGDRNGIYNSWIPTPGAHTIVATPYSGSNASGDIGQSLEVGFTVLIDNEPAPTAHPATVSGELKKWHRVTFAFSGPSVSEKSIVNPFLDYRLDVTFTNSAGKSYKVPGYYATDGNAGETGATLGNKWKVHFTPDTTGTWTYVASFKNGPGIAVIDDLTAGIPVSSIDGAKDTFLISPSDKTGKDLRAKGRLKYVGAAYLQFAETGEYFRKAGSDAPENFLAYEDFDNTPNYGGRRKTWEPHIRDWNTGDPTWHNGQGKGIIGAVNYLSERGMNVFSFLTMNINGDDKNVFPFISDVDFTRIDVSKMDQWEIVFEHAQKMGMYLHFKMQETENDNLLDGGELGIERKLYCRELIARFSHHLALNWNIGEENTQTTEQRKKMAKYIYDHDPYKHNIVIHTFPGQQETVYRPLLGTASNFTGVSIQTDTLHVYSETRKWVEASADAEKKWIVANDEQSPSSVGVAADAEYTGDRGSAADNSEQIRKNVLWANLMAGGAGVEYYFGYSTGETDLTCQDFRSRAKSWRYAKYALVFFQTYFSKTELKPLNNVSKGWCLGKESEEYIVYLKNGGTSVITLPAGSYSVKWYNPRAGGSLQNGSAINLPSGTVSIGYPPAEYASDWVALITAKDTSVVDNIVFAINAGGPAYTASNGITYDADKDFVGGRIYQTPDPIANTTDDILYQSERYGDFNYNIPIIKGTYEITFRFAEIYHGTSGKRQFDVLAQGSEIISDLDIYDLAGQDNPYDVVKTIVVDDTILNLQFHSDINYAKLSALHIKSFNPAINQLSISLANEALIEEIGSDNITLYPNPTSGLINVLLKQQYPTVIKIYNNKGINIYKNSYSKKVEQIDLSAYSSGIYYIQLLFNDKKIIRKVVLIK